MEEPPKGVLQVPLDEDERKMMLHFLGSEKAPDGKMPKSAVSSNITSKRVVGAEILSDSTRLGPPLDACMRTVYGKNWQTAKCKTLEANAYDLKPVLPRSPSEFWKGQITFTDVDPSPETPGSRFILVKIDDRIPCLEFSATMLGINRFIFVLQAPSRLQTFDHNENMSVGEVTMCLSMGGVTKGCEKPAIDERSGKDMQNLNNDPTRPTAGIMLFYSIIINSVYKRRKLYFGPKCEDEDLQTFARRFANNVEPVYTDLPCSDPGISYMRVSVSDTVAPYVVSGDAWDPASWDPRSTSKQPYGHVPVDASFDDIRMCGSAIIPIVDAPSGIWICGGRFGIKWMLTHVMVLPNMFDPTLRTLLAHTTLEEPLADGEEREPLDSRIAHPVLPEQNAVNLRMIVNALQRWNYLEYMPLIECPTATPRVSVHLTPDSVKKVRAGRFRKDLVAKRVKEIVAENRRSSHRAQMETAAKKQRDDNEYLRAKHEAIDLVGRVFRNVEEQERVRREARFARAQIRLARRVRAQQFARQARLELANALRLRRTEALRGLNAAVAERALARPAERVGELESRAHHARRRPPPAPAVVAVDVNVHRQKQRRKFERRAARRAEKARTASKPSIEVVKRSSSVFWTTAAPAYAPPPKPPPEPPHINVVPLIDFAQWEADFEADLVDEWDDAIRRSRFKEAQPQLRMDELRRIQARWAEERAAQPPASRKVSKRLRKAANVRAWRDGVRTDTEQLLQAQYTGINRAYGEATVRYKATVEKLTAEKEAARAETVAIQKSSYNAQECVVCMDAARTEVALPCKHFCVCAECASQMARQCPMCNGAVTAWLGVRTA